MLGIPPADTPERAAFLAQFWPALWSGIFSSVLTGIIVGVILIWWQRLIEERAARRSYAAEVAILRERLREAVAIPDVFSIVSAWNSVPPRAEAAMGLLRDRPISLWRSELKSDAFLEMAHDFQRSFAGFISLASEYDQKLSQFARAFDGARGAISANDPMVISYVFGRFQGFPPEQLAPWLQGGLSSIPPQLDEALAQAASDQGLRSAQERYAASRQDLINALTRLLEKIDA